MKTISMMIFYVLATGHWQWAFGFTINLSSFCLHHGVCETNAIFCLKIFYNSLKNQISQCGKYFDFGELSFTNIGVKIMIVIRVPSSATYMRWFIFLPLHVWPIWFGLYHVLCILWHICMHHQIDETGLNNKATHWA
jgi:hypothetical protein